MSKKFFLKIAFFCVVCACASQERQVFNYPNGNVRVEGYYEKGTDKQVGIWKYYDENGKLQRVENYKDGKKEGESLTYYDSGNLKSRSFYKSNFLDGEHIQFYDNATNQRKFSGVYKILMVNGIYDNNPTKLSVKDGDWKYYAQSGDIDSVINYQGVEDVYLDAEFLLSKDRNDTLAIDSVIKIDYIKRQL